MNNENQERSEVSKEPDDFIVYRDLGPFPDSDESRDQATTEKLNETTPDPESFPEQPTVSSQPAAKRGGLIREVVETALIAILIFVAVRSVVLNFRVDGESMMPNLVNGEMLLVNRNAYDTFDLYGLVDWLPGVEHANAKEIAPFSTPHRGDIIVFDPPVNSTKPYIKRIIGLPGDTVEIRDGNVYINGDLLHEPYIEAGITDCSGQHCGPITLGDSQIWVMGDNRRNSSDSRSFGPAELSSVEGETIVTYWPLSEVGRVKTVDYDDQH